MLLLDIYTFERACMYIRIFCLLNVNKIPQAKYDRRGLYLTRRQRTFVSQIFMRLQWNRYGYRRPAICGSYLPYDLCSRWRWRNNCLRIETVNYRRFRLEMSKSGSWRRRLLAVIVWTRKKRYIGRLLRDKIGRYAVLFSERRRGRIYFVRWKKIYYVELIYDDLLCFFSFLAEDLV